MRSHFPGEFVFVLERCVHLSLDGFAGLLHIHIRCVQTWTGKPFIGMGKPGYVVVVAFNTLFSFAIPVRGKREAVQLLRKKIMAVRTPFGLEFWIQIRAEPAVNVLRSILHSCKQQDKYDNSKYNTYTGGQFHPVFLHMSYKNCSR